MRKKIGLRVILVALLLVVAMLGAGCPQGTQVKTATAMRDFAYSVQALQQGEINYHKIGKIDDATHQRFQQGILIMANLGPQIDAAVATNNKAAVLGAIDSGLAATDAMLNKDVIAIADPTTKLEVQTLLLTIRITLANGKVLASQ